MGSKKIGFKNFHLSFSCFNCFFFNCENSIKNLWMKLFLMDCSFVYILTCVYFCVLMNRLQNMKMHPKANGEVGTGDRKGICC